MSLTLAGLWQRLSIIVGWTWLMVLGLRAIRDPPNPAAQASREETAFGEVQAVRGESA